MPMVIADPEASACFTDEELEYVYLHLDVKASPRLVKAIETKIRRQIPGYRKFDDLVASGLSFMDAAAAMRKERENQP